MAPSNISFATATPILLFPYSYVQSDINDGGINYDVYYQLTAPIGASVMSAFGWSGSTYVPTISVYDSAQNPLLYIEVANKPVQFPVIAGQLYYLKFAKNQDTAGPESLTVNVDFLEASAIVDGSIIVNDDTAGFPLAVLSGTVDNTVLNFYNGLAAGESGDIYNGVIILNDFVTYYLKVYNSSFVEIGSLVHEHGDVRIRTCHGLGKFYVLVSRNPCILRDVLVTGVYGSVNLTLTGLAGARGMAVSNDGTIMYHDDTTSGSAVKRWNLSTNAATTDLAAGITNYYIVDILVNTDDSIIVLYQRYATGDVIVRRYNAAGDLLNTYEIGYSAEPAGTFARLAYANDNPTSFWVWTHTDDDLSKFLNINVADGAILTTRTHTEYEGGIYQGVATATPTARYGHSFSCPFMIMNTTGNTPPDDGDGGGETEDLSLIGGIYFINTSKQSQHDSYYNNLEKKIPDPTFKTAFIGE